jgi:hypothetical protein
LAQALQSYLSGAGSSATNAPLNIQITPSASQNVGGDPTSRQFIVTIHSGADAGSPDATAPVVPSDTGATTPQATAPATPNQTAAPPAPAAKNEADAYWATQPAAVQVLRTISNEGDRAAKAQDLAKQGYAIDVPIMVWNLDPLSIMSVRQSSGMTWIPTLGQTAPQTGPGITFPGMTSYDPLSPLPGSLPVTTDWAKGLESTSPWSIGADVARL